MCAQSDIGPFNYETNMVPIIGLTKTPEGDGTFGGITDQHNALLLQRIASTLDIQGAPTKKSLFDLC